MEYDTGYQPAPGRAQAAAGHRCGRPQPFRMGVDLGRAKRVPPIYDQTSAMVDSDPALFQEYRGRSTTQPRAVPPWRPWARTSGRSW